MVFKIVLKALLFVPKKCLVAKSWMFSRFFMHQNNLGISFLGLKTCKLEHKILNENQSPKSHFYFGVKKNLEWSKVKTKHFKVFKTTHKISILNAQRKELECLTTCLWMHVAKITLECHGLKSSLFFLECMIKTTNPILNATNQIIIIIHHTSSFGA